jgi:hypothetical protein
VTLTCKPISVVYTVPQFIFTFLRSGTKGKKLEQPVVEHRVLYCEMFATKLADPKSAKLQCRQHTSLSTV